MEAELNEVALTRAIGIDGAPAICGEGSGGHSTSEGEAVESDGGVRFYF